MSKSDQNDSMMLSEAETVEMLREMALDMQVALYRRYDTKEAVGILNIPERELEDLRKQGEIGYLLVGENHVAFFGRHLLTYLMQCEVPAGVMPKPREVAQPEPEAPKPVIHPEAEFVSVNDARIMLGIGKTKIYDLFKTKQINRVKIGSRTLIKRTELQAYMDAQSA